MMMRHSSHTNHSLFFTTSNGSYDIRKIREEKLFVKERGAVCSATETETEALSAQHSLRAYLQTWDWILLQSMSSDPSNYGWTVGAHGYKPVPILDPMAAEELLRFTTCSCNGDCSNQRCSQKDWGQAYLSTQEL